MATRGFEFAYMLDGSNATPLIKDMAVDGTGAYAAGDLVLLNSDGQLARVTNTTTEVTAVIQEARASGSDGGLLKAAIITRNQVWRCSTDAAALSNIVVGYTKTVDTTDHNTVSASDASGGAMCIIDTGTDDEGNVLAYVVFLDTTFGNT
jgi:hypothetical protein